VVARIANFTDFVLAKTFFLNRSLSTFLWNEMLSWPGRLVIQRDGLHGGYLSVRRQSPIQVLAGLGVEQLRNDHRTQRVIWSTLGAEALFHSAETRSALFFSCSRSHARLIRDGSLGTWAIHTPFTVAATRRHWCGDAVRAATLALRLLSAGVTLKCLRMKNLSRKR